MQLSIKLGSRNDTSWAQSVVREYHYLHKSVHPQQRPITYLIQYQGNNYGLIMAGIPHATKCAGWWGYPGLPTQWQVVDLCRIWLDPALQTGGYLCSPDIVPGFMDRTNQFKPTTPTWAISQILKRIQTDWIAMWPPVYPSQPYHVELVVSYHDPQYHKGTIYRQLNAIPMYQKDGQPIPSPSSGKFGWCWKLPRPSWQYTDITILRPRTLRLPLVLS